MPRHARILTTAGALALVAAAAAVAPSTASASCLPLTAVGQLSNADLAFVGRLTERRPDRLIFTVDEALKGSPGATVEIPQDDVFTSISLNPKPDESIGLTVRRAADGTLDANDCDRSAPANLRAAAAAPDTDCTTPQARAIQALDPSRLGEPARFRVRLTGAQGRRDRLHMNWGDGSATVYRLDAARADSDVTVIHRFRRAGLRRVRARTSAQPVLACNAFGMPPRATSSERTLRVRVERN